MNPRYRQMLQRMKAKNKTNPVNGKNDGWFLYILECCDGSFYTGITKNMDRRLQKHNNGKGAAYTRSHRPVKLIYQENCIDRTAALIRELKIKSMNRKQKENLVGFVPKKSKAL